MIDLKPEYLEMGKKEIMQGETGIPVKEQKQGQMALFSGTLCDFREKNELQRQR